MDEIIQVKDQYYIQAASCLADDRTRVLKQGETFAVFDCRGDIQPIGRACRDSTTREPAGSSQPGHTIRQSGWQFTAQRMQFVHGSLIPRWQ